MIKITISHNGKEYDSLQDAFPTKISTEIEEVILNDIKICLKNLAEEILKEGGRITLNIGDKLQGKKSIVTVTGFSPELYAKIQVALSN